MPTSQQFRETAKRFQAVVEYGVAGMLLGDNEAARAAVACQMAADLTEAVERLEDGSDDLAIRLRSEADVLPHEVYTWLHPLLYEAAAKIEKLQSVHIKPQDQT